MGSSMSMASRVATGSRTGCISTKSDKCLKARTVSGESRNREILMIAIHRTKRQRGLIWFGAARAIIGIFLAAALACCTATPATAAEDLYRAQTVVTGQGEANRMIGFASCMEDVLIKVSGAERLAGDRRLAAYKAKAKDFVTAFDYRDQFSSKPKRDGPPLSQWRLGARDSGYLASRQSICAGSKSLVVSVPSQPFTKSPSKFAATVSLASVRPLVAISSTERRMRVALGWAASQFSAACWPDWPVASISATSLLSAAAIWSTARSMARRSKKSFAVTPRAAAMHFRVIFSPSLNKAARISLC